QGTSPASSADQFVYIAGCHEGHAPAVTSVEPRSGPAGTSVTVEGERFFTVVCMDEGFHVERVFFGFAEATRWHALKEGDIVPVAPPGTGTADVTVESGRGQSPTSEADRFAYATGA